MTTGQLVFYSGFVLFGLTIITTIVFLLKRPRYIPENAAYRNAAAGHPQQLQNSYPSELQAIHDEKAMDIYSPIQFEETEKLETETAAIFQEEETEILSPMEEIQP